MQLTYCEGRKGYSISILPERERGMHLAYCQVQGVVITYRLKNKHSVVRQRRHDGTLITSCQQVLETASSC